MNALIVYPTPRTFTPITQSQPVGRSALIGFPDATPALAKMTCTVPYLASTSSRILNTAEASATSQTIAVTFSPAVMSSFASRIRTGSSMSTMTTLMPSARKRFVVASPIPEAAPVMTATLSFNSIFFSLMGE